MTDNTKFYTNAVRYGNKILWRGYENGRKFMRKVDYTPSLYLENTTGCGLFSLDKNKPLKRYEFETMAEAKKFTENFGNVHGSTIYGNTNYISQFLADMYPGEISFDESKITILKFDIEVDISTGKPNMASANKPITSISLKFSTSNTYWLLGLKDYDKTKTETGIDPDHITFHKFANETEMLSFFVKLWTNNYPDVVTGWNCEYFDIQYVVTRIAGLLGDDKANSLSPWGIVKPVTKEMYGKMQNTYHIYGISILDFMDAFKKFGYKYGTQETYKLDHIAHVVLGENKLSYEEYGSLTKLYEMNPQKYLDYNLKDTHLIQRMQEETALLSLVFTVAYEAGVNYKETFGTVGIWETILYRRLLSNNIMPAIKGPAGVMSANLVGGFVKDPIPGKYRWVVSFDLNSLYPHLMKQYNMSPETLMKGLGYDFIVEQFNKIKHNYDFDTSDLDEYIDSGGLHKAFYDIDNTLFGDGSTETERTMFGKIISMLGVSVCANGVLFSNAKRGTIPNIIDEKYGVRKKVKGKMLGVETDIEDIKAELKRRGVDV